MMCWILLIKISPRMPDPCRMRRILGDSSAAGPSRLADYAAIECILSGLPIAETKRSIFACHSRVRGSRGGDQQHRSAARDVAALQRRRQAATRQRPALPRQGLTASHLSDGTQPTASGRGPAGGGGLHRRGNAPPAPLDHRAAHSPTAAPHAPPPRPRSPAPRAPPTRANSRAVQTCESFQLQPRTSAAAVSFFDRLCALEQHADELWRFGTAAVAAACLILASKFLEATSTQPPLLPQDRHLAPSSAPRRPRRRPARPERSCCRQCSLTD